MMDNLCRICRQTGDNAHLKSMMITGLLEVYSFCTNIPISEDSEKTYKICEQCSDLLIRFNEFKKLCIESDNYFKQSSGVEVKIEFTSDPLRPYVEDNNQPLKDDHYDSDNYADSDHFDENDKMPIKKRSSTSSSQHQCDICFKKFAYAANLKKHALKCNNKSTKEEKKTRVKVDVHIPKEEIKEESDSNKQLKKNVCLTCNKEFARADHYRIHMRTHTGERPYECLYCGNKYSTASHLKIHTQRTHLRNTEYSCHFCPKIFYTTNDLKQHLNRHTNEKFYDCDLCQKKFTSKFNLRNHLKNHSNEKECKICKVIFASITEYRRHILIHMQDDPFKCKLCKMDFLYLKSFKHHVKTEHPEKQDEDCIENPQQLLSANDTEDAILDRVAPVKRKLKPDSEKKCICNICGKRFMTNHSLESHIRRHKGEKPYACDKCEMKFSDKGNLNQHQTRMHDRAANFQCSICSFKTYTGYMLERHTKSHYDEKPYSCNVCNATFKYEPSLKVHMRIHTGEKPYHCTYCSKSFTILSYLKGHLATHTGERKFACDICEKKFINRTPFVKHMEWHKNGSKPRRPRKNPKRPDVKNIDTLPF